MAPAGPSRFTRPIAIAVTIGIALGLAIPAATFGTGVTHQGCAQGKVVGWSGWVATPWILAIQPPGGFVTWSVNFTTHEGLYINTTGGASPELVNSTTTDYAIYNWTAVAETKTTVQGWGPNGDCPPIKLLPPSALRSSCVGCPVAPTTPAGVGERSVIPTGFSSSSNASVKINATYPGTPSSTFSWSSSGAGDVLIRNINNFSSYMSTSAAGPLYVKGVFLGLGLQIQLSRIQFGVPIHMLDGTVQTLHSEMPASVPGAALSITITYAFPVTGDQGTWNMYYAGSDSAYPLGGFVFEQTATT